MSTVIQIKSSNTSASTVKLGEMKHTYGTGTQSITVIDYLLVRVV